MEVTITGLPALALISALTVLPMKIAATWFEASRTNILYCFIASIVGPALALVCFSAVGGGVTGFLAALVAMTASLGVILGTGMWSAIKLGIVALILTKAIANLALEMLPGLV